MYCEYVVLGQCAEIYLKCVLWYSKGLDWNVCKVARLEGLVELSHKNSCCFFSHSEFVFVKNPRCRMNARFHNASGGENQDSSPPDKIEKEDEGCPFFESLGPA